MPPSTQKSAPTLGEEKKIARKILHVLKESDLFQYVV
jgi:hypothetical protein